MPGIGVVQADLTPVARRSAGLLIPFVFGLLAVTAPSAGEPVVSQAIHVASRPIAEFRIGSDETRFGPFEFVGGLEMTSDDRRFSGVSSFRFLSPGERFIGVTDTGFWLFGAVRHGEEGRPSGVEGVTMMPILGQDGGTSDEKWHIDAEAIAVKGDEVVVGFERAHRIAVFELDPPDMGRPVEELDFLVPAYELRINQGFETVAFAPQDSALAGALVAVTERSLDLDRQRSIFAAVLSGPRKGVFSIARRGDFDITDGAFLPNGDLLLLERRFSFLSGVAMRIRRIDQQNIRPGAIADGAILLEADMNYQIDNMEALEVWENASGQTMISLVSDDNHSFLQRNLYLEFRFDED